MYFKNTNNILNSEPYQVLKNKRKYEINSNIGCFLNTRSYNKSNILLNYWEYYCSRSPIWKERFLKYKCKFTDKNPVFINDDILENFYDKYGFEPDEQSKETQLKSTREIKKNNVKNWLKYVFEQNIEILETINYINDY